MKEKEKNPDQSIKYFNVLLGDFMNQIDILTPHELNAFIRLSTYYVEQKGVLIYDEKILKRKAQANRGEEYEKAFHEVINFCFEINDSRNNGISMLIIKEHLFSSITEGLRNTLERMEAKPKKSAAERSEINKQNALKRKYKKKFKQSLDSLLTFEQRSEINKQNALKAWAKRKAKNTNENDDKKSTENTPKTAIQNTKMQTFNSKSKSNSITIKKETKKVFASFSDFTKTSVLKIHGLADASSCSLSQKKYLHSEMEHFTLMVNQGKFGAESKIDKVLEHGLKDSFWKSKISGDCSGTSKVAKFAKHYTTIFNQMDSKTANLQETTKHQGSGEFKI